MTSTKTKPPRVSGWDARVLIEHAECPCFESKLPHAKRSQRRLAKKGLLESFVMTIYDISKTTYRITDAGREALTAYYGGTR